MMQSYLVTEDDNKRLNSSKEVFELLVTVLDCSICRQRWCGYGFSVIEVIEVEHVIAAIKLNLFQYWTRNNINSRQPTKRRDVILTEQYVASSSCDVNILVHRVSKTVPVLFFE